MVESMLALAWQIPDFSRLWNKWSEDNVRMYVETLCLPDSARDTITLLTSDSLDGLAVAYHERVEMDVMERLFDEHVGQDDLFYQLVSSGKLERSDLWFNIPGDNLVNAPYLVAHEIALKKEIDFVYRLASRMGYELSLPALALTRPSWLNLNYKKSSIDELQDSFPVSYDSDSKPTKRDLKDALQFWQTHNANYVKEAVEAINDL